jgi:hypothetical protein
LWLLGSTYGLIFVICFDNSGVKVVLSGFVSARNVGEKVIGGPKSEKLMPTSKLL